MKKIIFLFMIIFVLFVSCASIGSRHVQILHSEPNTDLYHADLNIPVFSGQDELNLLVSKKIGEWFNQFEEDVLFFESAYLDEKPSFAFYSDWKKSTNSKNTISFLLTAYSYTGGANGEDKLYSFNWDKKSKKLITLDEILPKIVSPPTLSNLGMICENQLKLILESEETDSLWKMIEEGTKAEKENFQIFTISKEGITFYFNKYQVAPGSLGIQKVFIPFLREKK